MTHAPASATPAFGTLLERAIAARASFFEATHTAAFRLFNGFTEGHRNLAIDLYGATAVLHDHAESAADSAETIRAALEMLRARFPWLRAAIVKQHNGRTADERRGAFLFGTEADTQVTEHGVRYAIDLRMNRDSSLYLDTRELRRWAIDTLRGKSVLNTFAYTGSLGIAAKAGGATEVVHLDRNRSFLELAKKSYALNSLAPDAREFFASDFFPQINFYKRTRQTFDCVFLDPPFLSTTAGGVVDLENNCARLINKVRPIIRDGGYLVAINNALFVSGRDYHATLEKMCGEYLAIEQLIAVPPDFTGYPETRTGTPVTDPAPFNHSTKIAILRVKKKVAAKTDPA